MDNSLKAFPESQITALEQRIEDVIAEAAELYAKAWLVRSIPAIGPVSVAMFRAEKPELSSMAATEAAAMTGLAPVFHDSGAIRGEHIISWDGDLSDMCCFRLDRRHAIIRF
ncbi:transposase [Komagataeibacter saccharivorans]|uniref:transposase n=1 Tax=Komagataeibacter saccharivorans TaxID=265959 RepID=UPI0024A8AC3D|nr:transposase [Komagataeibacter saccharivorans]